ncbi:MAG: tryptophan synthase subunit alpha [Rhodospirillales bacterium]|jgi:tryptophan synthase alpha chain|nr:tryptophan synthase subunit alpha [Rhodospirillales bacterium]
MSKGSRIDERFGALKRQGRGGLVTFITAGDPDFDTSLEILLGLPAAGADVIELGMPFSDPMADGPAIQASSQRALRNGATLGGTLDLVEEFRRADSDTPVILMGYYNPIYIFGVQAFLTRAKAAGVDGLIIVDLPPEEEAELCLPAREAGIDFIFLAAPTTGEERLKRVLEGASGFVYYVSVTGITGTKSAVAEEVAAALDGLRRHTDLPIAVGFGIKTPDQAAAVARFADAAVVGSALVGVVAENLDGNGAAQPGLAAAAHAFVGALADGVRGARHKESTP